MEYVNLGNTGLRVSRVCLGMMSYGAHEERPWALPEADAEPIIRRAVEGGITFFDTADVYNGGESEVVTGRVLPQAALPRGARVATKVHGQTMPGENGRGLSRKHVMASIDASLQRLGLDYVDLYQIHRWDYATPIEETMEALHDVVKAGKARYIGASSMFAWQFAKAQAVAGAHGATRFVSMQNHYNLVYREEEREMIPQCIDQGVAVLPWSPLARGLLAGQPHPRGRAADDARRDRPVRRLPLPPEVDFDVVDRVERGRRRARRPERAGGARLAPRPARASRRRSSARRRSRTSRTRSPRRQLELTADEVARLEELYVPHAVSGHECSTELPGQGTRREVRNSRTGVRDAELGELTPREREVLQLLGAATCTRRSPHAFTCR